MTALGEFGQIFVLLVIDYGSDEMGSVPGRGRIFLFVSISVSAVRPANHH
jgi:hypothetical protein